MKIVRVVVTGCCIRSRAERRSRARMADVAVERSASEKDRSRPGRTVLEWITTTDHKVIGNLYMVTAFGFFLVAGVLAMLMRAELARPGMQIFSSEQYNQL